MFGLPVIAAALALMGAPAGTPASCGAMPQFGVDGLTFFHAGTVTAIQFSQRVCAGVVYLAASPRERAALQRLNPDVPFVQDGGVAAVVTLHEAHHASGDHDETLTECAAMRATPAFVAQYVRGPQLRNVLAAAREYDSLLPASVYHREAC